MKVNLVKEQNLFSPYMGVWHSTVTPFRTESELTLNDVTKVNKRNCGDVYDANKKMRIKYKFIRIFVI